MKYITNPQEFYKTKEWEKLKALLMLQRVNENGEIICAHCQKPIVKKYDCIGHHKIALTIDNVNDVNISLNPENIDLVHFRCHNEIENRFGFNQKRVYLVHGAVCSGKSSWTREQAGKNDLIIDMDNIWECISNNPRYIKPQTLKQNVFAVYNALIDNVSCRLGNWSNCYVITTKPLVMDRKRLADRLGAEIIHIDTDERTCLERLYADENRQQVLNEYEGYIKEYFKSFQSDDLI